MNTDNTELFCCQCFASESSGSWDHVVVGGFCTNCCGNGTTFPLPKQAIESIRTQASWVGKRYYPHAEDIAAQPRAVPDGWVLVPKKMTLSMAVRGKWALCDHSITPEDFRRAWDEILAAAPTQGEGDG